jgi:hypothetical protein
MKFKMLLFVFATGLFYHSSVIIAQETNHFHKSDIAKYSLEFPAEFKNLDDKNNIYAAKSNGMTFFAYHSELENKELIVDNESKVLLILLYNGVQQDFGGKVDSQENVTINGYLGKKAFFKKDDLIGVYFVFLNLYNGYAYHLVVLEGENGDGLNTDMANEFVKTFKIL